MFQIKDAGYLFRRKRRRDVRVGSFAGNYGSRKLMNKCGKLLLKAKNSPNNLSFDEICFLAECNGFLFQRKSSSHVIYENPNLRPENGRIMNFQSVNGKAKPYQVRQLLKAIYLLQNEN